MDLKLDVNGDLDTTNGELTIVDGGERMAQQTKIRLRMFLSEWFLDERQGMPWFQLILAVKPFPEEYATSKIRQAILSVPGVISVRNLVLTPDSASRQLTVSFEAIGDADEIPIFTEFVLP